MKSSEGIRMTSACNGRARMPATDRLASLLTLALLVLPACGNGNADASTAQAQAIVACSLLTKAEVEAALGAAVDEPYSTEGEASVPGGQGLTSQCNYDRGITEGVAIVVRQFLGEGYDRTVTSEALATALDADFEADRADPELAPFLPTVDPVDLAGHAAAVVRREEFVNLTVRVHGRIRLQLTVTAPTLAIARSIAVLAVSRLPD